MSINRSINSPEVTKATEFFANSTGLNNVIKALRDPVLNVEKYFPTSQYSYAAPHWKAIVTALHSYVWPEKINPPFTKPLPELAKLSPGTTRLLLEALTDPVFDENLFRHFPYCDLQYAIYKAFHNAIWNCGPASNGAGWRKLITGLRTETFNPNLFHHDPEMQAEYAELHTAMFTPTKPVRTPYRVLRHTGALTIPQLQAMAIWFRDELNADLDQHSGYQARRKLTEWITGEQTWLEMSLSPAARRMLIEALGLSITTEGTPTILVLMGDPTTEKRDVSEARLKLLACIPNQQRNGTIDQLMKDRRVTVYYNSTTITQMVGSLAGTGFILGQEP
jgi:hypothetical protein